MKKLNTIMVALVCGMTLQSNAIFGVDTVADGRCGTWGDSVDQGQSVKNRVDFALACEKNPRLRAEIEYKFSQGILAHNSTERRAGYPTYGVWSKDVAGNWHNPDKWQAPTSATTNCALIKPNYEVAFFCVSGCYTGEQGILFAEGNVEIASALDKNLTQIMALSKNSTLDQPMVQEMSVAKYVSDVIPGKQEVLRFTMQSGGELRVTFNHPLVDSKGLMRQAQEFRTGDALVKASGKMDPIVKIQSETIFGRVYNLQVESTNPESQIIVAQGYLNGSVYYQNEGVKDLNRRLLRTATAAKLIQ